ncbi:hypothetical protein GQ457_18G000190 [Hibiscus cannabinus]
MNMDEQSKAEYVKKIHQQVKENLERMTQQYETKANKGKKRVTFDVGLVLLEKGWCCWWCCAGEAVTRIEKEEMLHHSRKDDEHKDTDAPIPTYMWTFEPAVPACGRTSLVAEMLQHTGVQNRQSAERTKQPRYFAAHMAPLQELTTLIKGTLKEQKSGSLEEKERKEKVKRGDLRERKLAAASSTSRPHHC